MELSAEDRAVLAHVVIDPDAWIAHALDYSTANVTSEQQQLDNLNVLVLEGKQIDPRQKAELEKRLLVTAEERVIKLVADKIARWKPEYLAQKDLPDYKTRAEREAELKNY